MSRWWPFGKFAGIVYFGWLVPGGTMETREDVRIEEEEKERKIEER